MLISYVHMYEFNDIATQKQVQDVLEICLASGSILSPLSHPQAQGTYGNVWRHFWLSQLGQQCLSCLIGRGQGCC